jgi:hypothetical protein
MSWSDSATRERMRRLLRQRREIHRWRWASKCAIVVRAEYRTHPICPPCISDAARLPNERCKGGYESGRDGRKELFAVTRLVTCIGV